MTEHAPTPWELIEATEHHGAYVVNSWGRTVCDLYAMSNPMAASVRNGGTSFPVHFDDMAANAAFIVKACNSYDEAMMMLGDVPGESLLDRLTKLQGWYLEMQIAVGELKHKLEVSEAVNRLSAPVGGASRQGERS